MARILTAAQARKSLSRQGKTISEFADEHKLDRAIVYKVLSKKLKGRNGEAHRAAVLLGMKEGSLPSAEPKVA